MYKLVLSLFSILCVQSQNLRDLAQQRGRFFGAAQNWDAFNNDQQYTNVHRQHFNMLTCENHMKMDWIHPAENFYNFQAADETVNYAQSAGQVVRGHTLVWHSQMPQWLEFGNWTFDQVDAILQDHISTVAGRFAGRMYAWDVVNEAINDFNGGLRDSFWLRFFGEEFIAYAFKLAREADPNALLFYNDYSVEEAGTTKADGMFNLVQNLVQQGVPIDGVGLQCHFQLRFGLNLDAFRQNIARITNLGLDVELTELDIRIDQAPGTVEQRLQQQADMYRDIVNICLEFPRCTAIVTWGFTDRYTWLTPNFDTLPLLFDMNYNQKASFYGVVEALS